MRLPLHSAACTVRHHLEQRYVAVLAALALSIGLVAGAASAASTPSADDAVVGRWDIDIHAPGGDQPSWLEIRRSGRDTFVGQFVGVVGSARPISRIEVDGGELRFSIPPQWEKGTGDLSFRGRLQGDRLTGSMTFPDSKRFDWSAVRAPTLQRTAMPEWGEPIRLFNGTDLDGWHAAGQSRWQVADGVLRNTATGANLVSERKFTDFKLHVELRLPEGSNSGIYLRGRHEVQLEEPLATPAGDTFGAVYGFLVPTANAGKGHDAWQSLDITLVGRRVTVAVNGRTVICDREIPGITGGALDSDEGAPGPLYLQGDHGPVEFRNITLTPAK